MKKIKATVYLGIDGARGTMIITVDDNATESEIEDALRKEALSLIGFVWHEE